MRVDSSSTACAVIGLAVGVGDDLDQVVPTLVLKPTDAVCYPGAAPYPAAQDGRRGPGPRLLDEHR